MDTAQKWNEEAADYQRVFQIGMNEYSKGLLTFLLDKGMLRAGCRVIDVGCGVGKYGTYFAAMGCDVTLTDISSKMIEMAEKNMSKFDTPCTTLVCDFNDVSPDHPAFQKKFDLGLSTMSPAVHDAATVKKFSDMTDGYCFITHFVEWSEPNRKAFYEKLGVAPKQEMGDFAAHIENVCTAIRENGYTPNITYSPYNWSDDRTPKEAAAYLLKRLEDVEITEALKEKALKIATELSNENGIFVDAVNTKVAWVYWNTKGE